MKLNEYIVKEYNKGHSALSEDDVERWIVDWYKEEFKAVGAHGELEGDTSRLPPMWLANWRKYAD